MPSTGYGLGTKFIHVQCIRLITYLHIRYNAILFTWQFDFAVMVSGAVSISNKETINASSSSLNIQHLCISLQIIYSSQRTQYEIV